MTAKKPSAKKTSKKTAAKKKPAAKKQVAKSKVEQAIEPPKTPAQKKASKKIAKLSVWAPSSIVATVFSSGRIPYAPGTWGSLWGVVLFPLFMVLPIYVANIGSGIFYVGLASACLLVLLYSIGIIAIERFQKDTDTKDAQEIVYDEFFGQILTYSIVTVFFVYFAFATGNLNSATTMTERMIYQFTPFLFFRLFDICKPWPINLADRRNSSHGVMLDDVLAAVYAAICSILVFLVLDGYII